MVWFRFQVLTTFYYVVQSFDGTWCFTIFSAFIVFVICFILKVTSLHVCFPVYVLSTLQLDWLISVAPSLFSLSAEYELMCLPVTLPLRLVIMCAFASAFWLVVFWIFAFVPLDFCLHVWADALIWLLPHELHLKSDSGCPNSALLHT